MSQEKQLDDYPEHYQVIMSDNKGNIATVLVGAHSRGDCITGLHQRFPASVITLQQVK